MRQTISSFLRSPIGRLLKDIARRYRGGLWTVFIVSNVVAIVGALQYPLITVFVSAVAGQTPQDGITSGIIEWLHQLPGLNTFEGQRGVIISILVVLFFQISLNALVAYLYSRVVATVNARIASDLVVLAADKALGMPIEYFDRSNTGELRAKLTEPPLNDIPHFIFRLQEIVSQLVRLAATIVVLFWLSTQLTALMVPVGIIIGFLVNRTHRRIFSLLTAMRAVEIKFAGQSHELLEGMRVVKQSNQELRMLDAYADTGGDLIERRRVFAIKQSEQNFVLEVGGLLMISSVFGVLALSDWGSFGERLGIGVGFFAAMIRAYMQLRQIVADVNSLAPQLPRVRGYADIVLAVEQAKPPRPEEPPPPPTGAGALDVHGVWFRYVEDRWALKDINFSVAPGSTTAIVGLSGSGKTTLLEILAHLRFPERGRVTLDGKDLDDYDANGLRGAIGYVNQEPFIFSGSLRRNLVFAKPDASEEEIEKAIRMAALTDVVAGFNGNLEAEMGDRGRLLSGGQRQRVALARVLMQQPAFLILDEATSALDIKTERVIFDHLMATRQERGLIAATHRLVSTTNFDRIVMIHDGRIVEEGSHAELMAHGGMYHDLFKFQTDAIAFAPQASLA
ncbi:MAG: ABC transporter ATP-binding protein [Alphaproteobacteria bacterium]|nr:ABC transporter ATP-binding protein [Alphaproteobacteria bacterium]MCW5740996.1 ABC transporter ATP-binding protein [Alphaproteobacteria bacterium]